MKIVVYGPQKRTGALRDGSVVDLSGAFAKYAAEQNNEPHAIELGEALVPSDLARLIEAGPRALDNAQQSLDYLFGRANIGLASAGSTVLLLTAVAAVAPWMYARSRSERRGIA